MPKMKYKRPRRRGGRTVYRNKRTTPASKRNSVYSTIKVILCIAGLAVLVFLGYSIGAPIHRYFEERKAEKELVAEEADEETNEVSETTAASETVTEQASQVIYNPVDIPPEEISSEENSADEAAEFRAGTVSLDVMTDRDQLMAELEALKSEGCTAAVFTLKAEGGSFYYNTQSSFASFADGIVKSEIYAEDFAAAAKEAGLIPIAAISLLEDHNTYGTKSFGSYKTVDGDVWYDDEGRSHLSPYDTNTVDYIADISSEIASAGFEYIICRDVSYPDFSLEDYSQVGEALAFGDRYTALVRVCNAAYNKAVDQGCNIIIEVNAAELIEGKAEVIAPDELECKYISVVYDDDSIGMPAESVKSAAEGMTVIPSYNGEDGAAVAVQFENGGFEKYIIY
ncbi:MAG: hypothetical protein IJ446_10280 [Oscillospiraceae bacterium]|nr:hypothetical protein [Oscillospiraceae bacterium]